MAEKTGARHAAEMDAVAFWRQYPATIDFLEPRKIVGTLEALHEVKARDDFVPKLHIRQDDGTLVIVHAGQTRLLAELVRLKPAVGDRIKIEYLGEEDRAAPGLNRTKKFAVAVRRAGPQPQNQTDGTSGEPSSDNDSEAGSK